MTNALLDNSDNFKLVSKIRELISLPYCDEILIATGYWDLPGMALLYDELKAFFGVKPKSRCIDFGKSVKFAA